MLPSSVTALNSTQVLATVRALHKLGAGQQRRSHCAADLLTYRDDLHDVINELRTEQIKGETPEERSKQVASLISQKKRATAEVLKELKRLGLSQNPPSRVLEDQQSLRALLAAGSVDHKAQLIPAQQLAFTVDATFYRLIRSLPSARLTPSNHHDDISSQDISKAVGSLESGLALVLSLRSQVGETLDHLHRFSAYQEWLGIAQAHSFQLSEKTDALSIYETFDSKFSDRFTFEVY